MKIVTYEGLTKYAELAKAAFVGNSSFAEYREHTAEMMAQINAKILSLTGLSGNDFLGTYSTFEDLQAALPDAQMSGWGLVGADLTSLKMHSTNNGGASWTEWEQTYDFTDFTGIKASLGGLSLKKPMSEDEWYTLTDGGSSIANLEPDTIYFTYES